VSPRDGSVVITGDGDITIEVNLWALKEQLAAQGVHIVEAAGIATGKDGLPYARALPDGRVLHLLPWRVGGVQLSVGWGDGYYTDTWIYGGGQANAGWAAARSWNGEGEPEGWYRHAQSGRRRPEGDPAKEFVRP
jgi:hypothetical protein